jgi:hypothetical protein
MNAKVEGMPTHSFNWVLNDDDNCRRQRHEWRCRTSASFCLTVSERRIKSGSRLALIETTWCVSSRLDLQ